MTEQECNRQFLKSSIIRQIFNCCNKEHYKAGVLVSNSDQTRIIDSVVNDIISKNFNKRVIRHTDNRYDYNIEFDNGSVFKIVLGANSARGHRYNDLLIDSELSEETQFCFGDAKMIPYYINTTDSLKTDGVNIRSRLVVLIIQ
jgi:hypothetical protein